MKPLQRKGGKLKLISTEILTYNTCKCLDIEKDLHWLYKHPNNVEKHTQTKQGRCSNIKAKRNKAEHIVSPNSKEQKPLCQPAKQLNRKLMQPHNILNINSGERAEIKTLNFHIGKFSKMLHKSPAIQCHTTYTVDKMCIKSTKPDN